MNDPQNAAAARLAAALRTQEPGALPAVFDTYSDRLFRYCWFMLRNRDVALIALRDTMVVAEAHIGRLTEPANLSSWLYALAHVECRRRRPVLPGDADEPPARPSQQDADSRLMAWNAVTSMDAAEVEALDLVSRHDVDLGLVLGLSGPDARALLDRARQDLERALGAEILVSRGSHACPDRVQVMRGWAGTVTPDLRDRVLRHAVSCPVCAPNLPRKVSSARVFALLPVITLPVDARQRVLTFFSDPHMAAYREFAVSRAADFTESGFPLSAQLPVPGSPAHAKVPAQATTPARIAPPLASAVRQGMPRGRILTAVAVTATAAAVAAALVLVGLGGGTRTPSREPTAQAVGPPGPRRAGAGAEAAAPIVTPTAVVSASPSEAASPGEQLFVKLTQPLPTARASGLPPQRGPEPSPQPTVSVGGPPQRGSLDVSPGALRLGNASSGQLTITAEGTAESWSATTSSGRLELSTDGGTLAAGQSVTLTVTVDRGGAAGGSAVLYVDQGTVAQPVQVSWAPAASQGHQPSPSPSPAPSPSSPAPSQSPSPSPSPSPSNSSGSSPPVQSTSPAPAQSPSQPAPSRTPHPSRSPRPIPTAHPVPRPTQRPTIQPTHQPQPVSEPRPTLEPRPAVSPPRR